MSFPQFTSNPNAPIEPTVQARIEVSEIPPDDNRALYIEQPLDTIFTDYMVHNHYENPNNIYMAGMTSPEGFNGHSVAFFQLAAPTLLWVADWTASRAGDPPIRPSEFPGDPNWVLLYKKYQPAQLALMPDGETPLYRISGTYVYGHLNPSIDLSNEVTFPRAPWMRNDFPRKLEWLDTESYLIDSTL